MKIRTKIVCMHWISFYVNLGKTLQDSETVPTSFLTSIGVLKHLKDCIGHISLGCWPIHHEYIPAHSVQLLLVCNFLILLSMEHLQEGGLSESIPAETH